MASLTRFLAERLRLAVNLAKSAVDRPWKRTFLGYTVTAHQEPRLRVAATSVGRLRDKLRGLFRAGRGRSVGRTAASLTPLLRGWIQYFRLAQAKVSSRNSTDGCGASCAASCGASGSDRVPAPDA